MQIRPANVADLPDLLALLTQLDLGEDGASSLETMTAEFEKITANPYHTIYVAEQAGALVGTFALIIVPQLAHGGTRSGIVEDVVVDADQRGQGIGQAMMWFAIERCREAGCYKLVLASGNRRVDAHRFYENLGFRQHGISFLIDL